MFTKRDNWVIKKIREGKWHFTGLMTQHLKTLPFKEYCHTKSEEIQWKMMNNKEVTDDEIRFWWRVHINYWNDTHYTKYWKKNRVKMRNHHSRYDKLLK